MAAIHAGPQRKMMTPLTPYLYIDNGYLTQVYRERFVPIFGDKYSINYWTIMSNFSAVRAFLYDCLNDVREEGELEKHYEARVQEQQNHFDSIDSVDGLHVRLGVLSTNPKKKKRNQKEVDVMLAVDMLNASFEQHTDHVILISGDRDYRPAVESLVRAGTLVTVVFDPKTGARELAKEADNESEIDITRLCDWVRVNDELDRADRFPTYALLDKRRIPIGNLRILVSGIIGPEKLHIGLCMEPMPLMWTAIVIYNSANYASYSYKDREVLLKYLEVKYGQISPQNLGHQITPQNLGHSS